jgi:hypothetical protein
MKKLPFEQLHLLVEKMYAQRFEEHETEAIDRHCLAIQALIEASGWDIDEYLLRWFYGETN